MPVVVVIGRDSIPAAILRLQRVVCPTLTSICAANCNSLASEPQRPDIRRVRVGDVRFNCLRFMRQRQAASKRGRLRQRILNVRIAFDSGHVLPASQRFGYSRGCLSPGSRSQCKRSDARCRVHATIEGPALVLPGSYSLAPRKRSDPSQPLSLSLWPRSESAWSASTTKNSAFWPLAVRSITHGAILRWNGRRGDPQRVG